MSFGAKPTVTKDTQLYGVNVQSSSYGLPIPICFGQSYVAGNLLDYVDFTAAQQTTEQRTGGKWGSTTVSTTFTYTAAAIFGICEGPIASIAAVLQDKVNYSWDAFLNLNGFLVLLLGTDPQDAWTYMTTHHADRALGYQGIAAVANVWLLNSGADFPNYQYLVNGLFQLGTLPGYESAVLDASPATVVHQLLLNTTWGCGWDPARVADITQFTNYVMAAGLFASPLIDTQRPARDWLTDILQMANTAAVWSDGAIKFVPYGDHDLSGAGYTYTADVTPLYDLSDDDFVADDGTDPVQVTRGSPADAYNCVQVEFANRGTGVLPGDERLGALEIAEAKDQAMIDRYGLRIAPVVSLHMIHDFAIARQVAQLILQRGLYVRNTYTWKTGLRYSLVEPMDLVTLTDPGLGYDRLPVRITKVEQDDSEVLTFTAEDWPFGVAHASRYPSQEASGQNATTGAVAPAVKDPVIFDVPGSLVAGVGVEIWMAIAGSDVGWGGCQVWVSTDDGSSYTQIGTQLGAALYGHIGATALDTGPRIPDEDTTSTLDVVVDGPGGTGGVFPSWNETDMLTRRSLCYVDGEFLSYETATLHAAGEYYLTTLYRGDYGVAPSSHASGSAVVFLGSDPQANGAFRYVYNGATAGLALKFKFPSFAPDGRGLQDLADCTVYTHTLGSPDIPIPSDFALSANVQGDASASVAWVMATWTPPATPFFSHMDYSVRSRRTGDTDYGAPVLVGGTGAGADRIPANPNTDVEVTPITVTTAGHAFTSATAYSISVPAYAPPAPAITATAESTDVRYGVTFDAGTKYIRWWSTVYTTATDPGSAMSVEGTGTEMPRIDNGLIGAGFAALVFGQAIDATNDVELATFVPYDGNNHRGAPINLRTVRATPSAPAAPTAAVNVSVTSSSVTNHVTMPGSVTNFDFIRVYRNGVVFGADVARTAGAGATQTLTHSGLSAGETDGWQYSGVSSAGGESSKTSTFLTTTATGTIPTPSIQVGSGYNVGLQEFLIGVLPAAGTPAGVTWHLLADTASPATTERDAQTSTTLSYSVHQSIHDATYYFRVYGTLSGWTASADSTEESFVCPHV